MITPAPAPAPSSSETFGLPTEASHLIAKLRNMPPELLSTIITKDTK